MLSSEQGVYIAEIVAAKNTKQSKGRFRMYEEQDGVVLLYKYLVFRFLLFTFSLLFLFDMIVKKSIVLIYLRYLTLFSGSCRL